MNSDDKPEFARLLAAVAVTFGTKTTRDMVAGYWMGLEDLPIEAVAAAFKQAIRSCKFFPRVAEIRELATADSTGTRAIDAWQQIVTLAKRASTLTGGEITDPIAAKAVRAMGGMRRLGCEMSSEDLMVWGKKEFERLYAELAGASVRREALRDVPKPGELDGRVVGLLSGIGKAVGDV
jgi:hypothetical protein